MSKSIKAFFSENKAMIPMAILAILVSFIFVIFSIITFCPPFRAYLFGPISIVDVPHGEWGTAGDFFGGFLNPIVSFSAFVAIVYTIRLQQTELSLQRKELQITNEQLEASAQAQKEQSEHLARQSFENTLFKMIDRHQANVEAARRDLGNKELQGAPALQHLAHNIKTPLGPGGRYSFEKNKHTLSKDMTEQDITKIATLHLHNTPGMTAYFRLSYRIFKIIWKYFGETKKPSTEELEYAKLFRSQISDDEIFIIFINSLTPIGEKYKFFINRYELLDNLDGNILPARGYLREQFNNLLKKRNNEDN